MGKTLSKEMLAAKVAAVFAHHSTATELHVAADGNCFLENGNAAILHSKSSGLKLEKHLRADYEKEIAAIEKDKAAARDKEKNSGATQEKVRMPKTVSNDEAAPKEEKDKEGTDEAFNKKK